MSLKSYQKAGRKVLERAALNTLLSRHSKLPHIFVVLQYDTDFVSATKSGEILSQVTDVFGYSKMQKKEN